ncbi:aminoglycoside phosphotransferase family protein [Streptomyces sp. CSDS2]|nr:aminoglycoside phosphotransferase family protein [Streptomyces sp. CSDS2]
MRDLAYVTPDIRDRLVLRFGPEVLPWCDELPGLVAELAARWDLDVLAAGGGGTSRVFRCARRGTGAPVWLKLTPDHTIAREEAEALRAWAATPSVVTLLAQDLTVGALLLDDVAPGVPLRRLTWRLSDAAALLTELRSPAHTPGEHSVLKPLSHRVGFLFDLADSMLTAAGKKDLFAPALARARETALELASSGPTRLVHGDLHPANVLSGPHARVVAIDPRPAWGDPDFDAVDWVLDGVLGLDVLEDRIGELAGMVPGQNPGRLSAWCRALAPLIAAPRVCGGRDDAETGFLVALADG